MRQVVLGALCLALVLGCAVRVQVAEQTDGAVAFVLVFETSDLSDSDQLVPSDALQRLNPGLLIDRNGVNALRLKQTHRFLVCFTNGLYLAGEHIRVSRLRIEPILHAMRTNPASVLKKSQRSAARWI